MTDVAADWTDVTTLGLNRYYRSSLSQTKVDLMRALLLLPAVLLVFLVRCESVGNNSVLVGLLSASDHDSTGVLSNGSSGEAGCRLHFTEEDNEVSLLDGWTQ